MDLTCISVSKILKPFAQTHKRHWFFMINDIKKLFFTIYLLKYILGRLIFVAINFDCQCNQIVSSSICNLTFQWILNLLYKTYYKCIESKKTRKLLILSISFQPYNNSSHAPPPPPFLYPSSNASCPDIHIFILSVIQ